MNDPGIHSFSLFQKPASAKDGEKDSFILVCCVCLHGKETVEGERAFRFLSEDSFAMRSEQ
jgi:hypothetical protein